MKLSRQMGNIHEASTSCVQRREGPTLIQDHLSPVSAAPGIQDRLSPVSAAPGVDVSSSACPPPPPPKLPVFIISGCDDDRIPDWMVRNNRNGLLIVWRLEVPDQSTSRYGVW